MKKNLLIFFFLASVDVGHLHAAAGAASGAAQRSLHEDSGFLDKVSKDYCDKELVGPRVPACIKNVALTRVFSVPRKDDPGVRALKLEQNPTVLRYLLEKGALPMQRGGSGLFPLHHFVSRPSCTVEVIQLLIKAGADVNGVDTCGWPVLHYAAACTDNPEVIKALIAAGAKVNAVVAIEERRIRADLQAMRLSRAQIQSILRKKGMALANEWPPIFEHNSTALHWAVRFNRIAVVEALLEGGADTKARDFLERTAEDIAREKEHSACLEILKRYGDIGAEDGNPPIAQLSRFLDDLILAPGI